MGGTKKLEYMGYTVGNTVKDGDKEYQKLGQLGGSEVKCPTLDLNWGLYLRVVSSSPADKIK